MGIDYNGGMIIGCSLSDIFIPDEFEDDENEYIEDNGMSTMYDFPNADSDEKYVGFEIENILVSKINIEWIEMVKAYADKFKALTGEDAKLIGTQDIW